MILICEHWQNISNIWILLERRCGFCLCYFFGFWFGIVFFFLLPFLPGVGIAPMSTPLDPGCGDWEDCWAVKQCGPARNHRIVIGGVKKISTTLSLFYSLMKFCNFCEGTVGLLVIPVPASSYIAIKLCTESGYWMS